MNIYFIFGYFILAFLGMTLELKTNKSSKIIQLSTIAVFIIMILSRINHEYIYSDLRSYIRFFEGNYDAYFEKGYNVFCNVVRNVFGRTGKDLVLACSIWVIAFFCLAIKILTNEHDTQQNRNIKHGIIVISNNNNYFSSLLFCFLTYWGCCFTGEGLRTGLGISLLFVSLALVLRGFFLSSFIPLIFATFFHTSMMLFLPVPFIVKFVKKKFSVNFYIRWLVIIIALDVLINLSGIFSVGSISNLLQHFSSLALANRFLVGYSSNINGGAYFSTQYIFYHLIAVLMLFGDFQDDKYEKSVFIYYIGLFIGSFLQNTVIVMRVQWIFLSTNVFAFYYFLRGKTKFSENSKYLIFSIYGIVQLIMMMRYLGFYW